MHSPLMNDENWKRLMKIIKAMMSRPKFPLRTSHGASRERPIGQIWWAGLIGPD
jgi:hypothetical protein